MSHSEPQTHPRLSAISVESAKLVSLRSGQLLVGRQKYKLCDTTSGALEQTFEQPIDISASNKIQVSFHHGKARFYWKLRPTSITIDTHDVFVTAKSGYSQVTRDEVCVTFFFQGHVMLPTTADMLKDCDRFRILVIGKTGVGKTTLIRLAFGIDKASASHLQRGKSDINEELKSPSNPHFVLHDSLGFEPGEEVNYDKVKQFIKSRQTGPLKGRLHAVWFCIETPCSGGRLMEAATEDFFKSKNTTLGNIPLVIIFTKLDGLVDELLMKKAKKGNVTEEDLEKRARAEAESTVLYDHIPRVTALLGETLSYAIISTKQSYHNTVANLVQLTYRLVSEITGQDEQDVHVTSLVTSMAQRIVPHPKIQECIDVGKKNYWKAISKSPDIAGNTIWDFLCVIHTDIVVVWNFNDPRCYLKNDKFMKLILESVREVRVRNVPNPGGFLAVSGASLVATISAFVGALANPAAPIVLPIVAGLAGIIWLYGVYQHSKNVEKYFITYIVDLTHVMETLFVLVAGQHERLTRRAIKLALKFYLDSDIRELAHTEIESYQKIPGRDTAVKMIEALVRHEEGNSSLQEYYSGIKAMDLSKVELNNDDEGW